MKNKESLCISTFMLVLFLINSASGQKEVLTLLNRPDFNGGLAVHLGTTNGVLESVLAAGDKYLVHGLSLDESSCNVARRLLRKEGIYGLASLVVWSDRGQLPYASNLVNVLIADTDALGPKSPEKKELMRVLAPDGILIVKHDGQWRILHKGRPAAIDSWGHFDHGADGNPVSEDTLVEPIKQQQWITGVQPNPFEGNPAGYSPGAGIRIWNRYAVMDVKDAYEAKSPRDRDCWVLQGRDAFNGITLWSKSRDREVSQRRWSLVTAYDEVYAWLKCDGNLTALDIASGKILREYPGTNWQANELRDETACIRATKKYLVVSLRNRIVCFDRTLGNQTWEVNGQEKLLLGPVIDEKAGKVYCIKAKPGGRREFGGRWPHNKNTESVLAIGLDKGNIVWECTEVASRDVSREHKKKLRTYRRGPGQLVAAGDMLIVFGSCAISGGESPYIAAINAKSGKMQHQTDEPFQPSYNVAAYNVLWRDNAAWFAGAFTNLWRYDPASGKVDLVLRNSWNQRCTRFTATPRYFLFGQSAYYDKQLSGEQVCVARSGCAMGKIPANGMTYFTPTACGCITQVRGFQAMTSEIPPVELPDEKRLVKGRQERATIFIDAEDSVPNLIEADWLKQWRAGEWETEQVKHNDIELVAIVHQHELQARREGKVLWSFIADGRISAPPVISGKLAFFGAHDGWVYAVNINDGSLRWKYLLAPFHRWICVNSQLESTWPVYGVCKTEGQSAEIIASAGTHVELSGGVVVASFEPLTGRVNWKKHLKKPTGKIPPGGRGAHIVGHSFINSVPRTRHGLIILGDGGRKGGEFVFHPDESIQSLTERLVSSKK